MQEKRLEGKNDAIKDGDFKMNDTKNIPLVTIVTPCFNGEKYLDRYFRDILAQDYPKCELVFMDDGSTDKTKEKVDYYKPLLEKKGYSIKYYYHDNIGLGGTIAKGVKHIKGEFFVWPDCDDGMSPNCISKKVSFLLEHPTFGLVRTNGIIEDDKGNYISDVVSTKNNTLNDTWLFDNYLFGHGAWLQPGSFMIRTAAFDKANPDRYIYPTRRGQDWQILLPVLYYFECGYIEDKLFQYVKHAGSLSDTKNFSFQKAVEMQNQFEEINTKTIEHMDIKNKSEYLYRVKNYYIKKRITVAFLFGEKKAAKKYYTELKNSGGSDWRAFLKSNLAGNVFVNQLYDITVGSGSKKK